MSSRSPIDAPEHILKLLSTLHKISLQQEAELSPETGKFISPVGDLEDKAKASGKESSIAAVNTPDFDQLMVDKFIALDEDKCQFVYQLIGAMGAANVVEAGTSFGLSTIYLALAIAKNRASGRIKEGKVIATEKEPSKAEVARKYWKECGDVVENQIELREGDLLQTLSKDLPQIDLLLLDIWTPLALPTLKIVQPHLRPGAVVLADNTISGQKGYKDLLAYLNAPGSGFQNMTLPFTNGFEMSVYLPQS